MSDKKSIDVRVGEDYTEALRQLGEIFREPTLAGMNRILIREAALRHGVWPQPENAGAAQKPQPAPAQPAEAAA